MKICCGCNGRIWPWQKHRKVEFVPEIEGKIPEKRPVLEFCVHVRGDCMDKAIDKAKELVKSLIDEEIRREAKEAVDKYLAQVFSKGNG